MLLTKLFSLLKNKGIAVYNTGVQKETDKSKQKYIILVNIAASNSALTTFLLGTLWIFFTPDTLIGFSSIFYGFILLIPVYLNSKGRWLAAKKCMVLCSNNILLISACIYSHDAKLENYYYSLLIAFSFIFSYEERKWAYLSVFITSIYYIIVATPLHHFLPNFNLIKDLDKSVYLNNSGSIILSLLELIPFIYITQQWQTLLMDKKKMLEDTKHQLQVQNEDLQTFSIAASHSLQTPVHISKFLLSKVKKNYEDPAQNKIPEKSMDIIEDSLNQMDQLVSGLFSYARIIKMEDSYELCNVLHEMETIKKRMEEKFTNSQVIIPAAPVYIKTNKILLSIIIQNIIDNGLKYNKSEKPAVQLHIEKTAKMVSFFITDNGIGIEKRFFNKVFEPFKRINPGHGFVAGNGLGLSGAKRAAERIGGKLFCKESSDKGSTFQLNILLTGYRKPDF